MALKVVTPRQFLTRVAFKAKMSTLCNHDNIVVHDDDEKIDVNALVAGNDDTAGANSSTQNSSNSTQDTTSTCRICYENACTVLFIRCRHMKICTPCYKIMYDNEKEKHRQLYPNDNELMDNDDIPPLLIKCPFCRQEHIKNDIIINIY